MRGKLYKSRDKKVCGVCGGIAEYFGIDPTIIRIVYALLVFVGGIGILPYIIAAIIMDDAPQNSVDYKRIEEKNFYEQNTYSAKPYYEESEEPVGFTLKSDNVSYMK